METKEKIKKQLKFSEDTKGDSTFTPLAKPHSSAVRKIWIKHCRDGTYEQLLKDLTHWQQKGLELSNFFNKEGECLLTWALINSEKSEALRFIIEHVPQHLIKAKIYENNYSLLNTFLRGESGLEKYNFVNEEALHERIEKIKLLLRIDEGLRDILNVTDDNLSGGVKLSVKQALGEVNLAPNK